MRILFPIIMLLTSVICFSQKGKEEIKYSRKIIEKSIIDEKEILSECLSFSKRNEKLTLNTNPKEIADYLRGVGSNGKWLDNEGYYIQYDLLEKSPAHPKLKTVQIIILQNILYNCIFLLF